MANFKVILSALFFGTFYLAQAQTEVNFYEVKEKFLQENKTKIEQEQLEGKRDATLERFNRWANFMENRIDPASGTCFDPNILWKEKQAFLDLQRTKKLRSGNSDWVSLGPNSPYDINNVSTGRLGRVNSITIHPTDTNTIFLGTPDGGIWKTTNGGQTWATNTDQLDNLGISEIVINPINPSIMYAATGDGYAYIGSDGFWGGTYSIGVIKSIDGGATWQITGLSTTLQANSTIRSIALDPNDANTIYAATNTALMRSNDAGVTWSTVLGGGFYSVEFNPKNANTVYAVGNALRKSIDGGVTWDLITPPFTASPTGDIRNFLGACHGDTNRLYFLFGKQDSEEVFRSDNGGTTWVNLSPQLISKGFASYGYYASVLEVDPNNDNKFLVGGIVMFESTNGGTTFNVIHDNVLHSDHRAVRYSKSQPGLHYIGCDGGFYKRKNNVLKMISEGLVISQIYNLALNPLNYQNYYVGLQDNGNKGKKGNDWVRITGADGMENLVDHTDTNHTFHTIQYGSLYESFDGGFNANYLGNAAPKVWILPLLQEDDSPFEIYQGSTSGLVNLTTGIDVTFGLGDMKLLAASKKFKKHWVACNGKKVYSSFGSAKGTWKEITGSLAGTPNSILDVAAGNNDSNVAYAVYGGFSAGKKVFKTSNNGGTWINITGTLPNIPVNTVIEGLDSLSTIYIGTDFGVFYRDKFMNDWAPFNKNLPNVIITDLRIADDADYIFAASYGRGLWRSPTQYKTQLAPLGFDDDSFGELDINIYPNPVQNEVNISSVKDWNSIKIYNAAGSIVFSDDTKAQRNRTIPTSTFANGVYYLQVIDGTQVWNKKIVINK
jgi:photosystem II stability/assembly factor-like uncharacterized protein